MAINLDHTPHPLVEDHWHIRELINAQERRAEDRNYHRQRVKELEERTEDIATYKEFETKEFYCKRCREDFIGQVYKQVEVDWTNTKQTIAFYKTKCFKGHWCIRLISDRHKDGYFVKSRRVARDRGKHFSDIVQPDETNFNLLFGKK